MIDYGYSVFFDTIDAVDPGDLLAWRNMPAVHHYCRQFDLITKAAHERWLGKVTAVGSDCAMYTVWEKQTMVAVGVAGLTGIDLVNRRAEFSLYIRPGAQKRGNGAEALKTLVSHGFRAWGLEMIWGESFDFNPARKLFLKLGFKEEGARRNFYFRQGRFVDAYLYSILRVEWKF